jgi:cytochrome c1
MTIFKIASFAAVVLITAACHSKKKAATAEPAPVVKSTTGIFAPGEEELTAIKARFPDATLSVLTEGHSIYTGTCTNCHGAKSIYRISEDRWQPIIDDMAKKAKITDTQKDALTKYVFAIKATQPK